MNDNRQSALILVDTMPASTATRLVNELEEMMPGQQWIVAPFEGYGLAAVNYQRVDKNDTKTLNEMMLSDEIKTGLMMQSIITGEPLGEIVKSYEEQEKEKNSPQCEMAITTDSMKSLDLF